MSSRLRLTTAVAAVALATLSVPGAALASSGKDSDRDGMPDKYERANGLNPRKNDARGDKDKDGLRNLAEFRAGTNPSKADSDSDGIRDGDDKRPRVKDDARVRFTVTSYDATTGALVVAYGKGSSLTVTVTDGTALEWRGHRKGCTSPATVADLVSGAGIDKLKLARPASDDDGKHDGKDDSGKHDGKDDGGKHDGKDDDGKDDGGKQDGTDDGGKHDGKDDGGKHDGSDDSGHHARVATLPGDDSPAAADKTAVAERIGLVCAAGS
ncbi:hypothetical protein [Paractinoplanes lichenicola]|uniref:Uncharacterized protein n=1 Tax=Paractinoplanes lichenicola TaxID=2802976 RepID=A0ABS1VGT3_9ACTN|nr:hypothetical protein [Actinoplanes lichenicola]MBL7253930.1 hypothetical protein [Actinoplanes lichenicola]